MQKPLPNSNEIEQAVLGALIVDEKATSEAMPLIRSEAFFHEVKHQLIFAAINDLYQVNQPIDLLTVQDKLKTMNKLEDAGGVYYLIELSKKVSSSAHIEYHSRLLTQYWIKRELIRKANEVISKAMSDEQDSFDLLEMDAKVNDTISEMVLSGSKVVDYATALDNVGERVERISNKQDGEVLGVTTGFKKLDQFTGGWQNSDLVIVAARPGMGKTSFVLKNLVECAKQNIAVGFISLEMSVQQLATRTVAINSNLHLAQLLRDGFDKKKYFDQFNRVKGEMQKFPVYIDDTASMDIRDIIARARIWKRKHDIQILIVDYIQLATNKAAGNNREQEIAGISRGLKMLAKELNIPVIALSQLSRKVEERGDKHPKLSDIRESGAIEQDADIVTFLYREEYYSGKGCDLPEELRAMGANAEINFAKFRNGSLETKGLYFDDNKAKYMDPDERAEYITVDEFNNVVHDHDDNPF